MSETQNPQTRWSPTDEQRALLVRLDEAVKRAGSQAEFARRFFSGGTAMLNQVLVPIRDTDAQSYFDKVSDATALETLERIRAAVEDAEARLETEARASELEIHRTANLRWLEVAVKEATKRSDAERLVVMTAPTRGGKSTAAANLVNKLDARVVIGRQAWGAGKSALVMLQDVCRAVGVRLPAKGAARSDKLEDALKEFARNRRLVLVIDEAEYMGRAAINLVKLLLNDTRIVVVLLVVPEKFRTWAEYWPSEAGQLLGRIHQLVEQEAIALDDAGMFFPEGTFAEPERSVKFLAEQASAFGHFTGLRCVAEELHGKTGVGQEAVSAAWKKVLKRKGWRG